MCYDGTVADYPFLDSIDHEAVFEIVKKLKTINLLRCKQKN